MGNVGNVDKVPLADVKERLKMLGDARNSSKRREDGFYRFWRCSGIASFGKISMGWNDA